MRYKPSLAQPIAATMTRGALTVQGQARQSQVRRGKKGQVAVGIILAGKASLSGASVSISGPAGFEFPEAETDVGAVKGKKVLKLALSVGKKVQPGEHAVQVTVRYSPEEGEAGELSLKVPVQVQ